jgi:hypothetical protein
VSEGSFTFPASTQRAQVVFAFFGQDDEYFPPAQKAMINLQVDDLDGVLDRLIDEGVTVDPKRESYDFGRFGWFTDPEGNRVELWQPSQRVDAELAQMSPEVGLWEETRFRFPRSPFLHNSRVADNPGVITCGPKE